MKGTAVLSSRRRASGLVSRRRETPEGVRYSTVELPASVLWGVTTAARLEARLRAFERGLATASTRARALSLLAQGWKPLAVAAELGLATRTVQRYRRCAK